MPEQLEEEEKKTPKHPPNRRVRTPTVLQMEAVECGAASLSIVLGYYGRFVPLETLRVDCGVSRDGSNASNALKAARKYGMVAKGFKYELENLYELKYPIILFWNFNHFLVLEGFKKSRVYINDPAMGPRTIPLEELDASFSGVALTFEPGPDFKKGGVRSNLLKALRHRLSGAKSALLFVVLCGLLLVIPGLVIPTFARVFIDEYLVSQKGSLIRPLLIGMGITAVLRMVLTGLQEYFLLRFETKLALTSASSFFDHVLRLPVSYFAQRYAGEIGSRVLINNRVAQVISGKLATTILNSVMIVFYAGLMFLYDVVLTATCIFLASINIVVVVLATRKRVDASRRLLQETGKLTGTAMSGLRMIETLKATGGEGDFFSRWAGYQAKALKCEQSLMLLSQWVSAAPPLVKILITTVILCFGGMRVMDGHLTVGMLVAFQSLMASFTMPLENFVNFGSEVQELEGDMNRLDDVLRYPQDEQFTRKVRPDDVLKRMVKLSGRLELRNVTFGYNPLDEPLIKDFNLKVRPGERVALVGSSGSGKSTIARLITGLYQLWPPGVRLTKKSFNDLRKEDIPKNVLAKLRSLENQHYNTEEEFVRTLEMTIEKDQADKYKELILKHSLCIKKGEILFDGYHRDELPSSLLNNSLGIVDQDIFLFGGSIRDNLTMWDSTVPDTHMTLAARDAVIDEVIQIRPSGYYAEIEEAGGNFSGGQRQRLEIARALVGHPSILILDEATSALDPTTEKFIDDNLRRRGCACVIVAHRLSTIRDCDEIIVMDKGKIVQRGPHEELVNQEGLYARLIHE